jgi:pectin methylesterase-like acyl-CoA thioesterase
MAKDKLRARFPKSEPIPLRPPSPPISPLNRSDSKYVQSYAVRNIQFNEDSRTTVAVVGQEGKTGVDYTVIQEAVDYADSLGGGNVFIKAGTYYPDKFITLRDNVYLIGEDPERTIVDFRSSQLANNESGMFAGGSNIYNLPSGTVAFTNGSKVITAAAATFLQANILAGDIAFIAFTPFVVQSVEELLEQLMLYLFLDQREIYFLKI